MPDQEVITEAERQRRVEDAVHSNEMEGLHVNDETLADLTELRAIHRHLFQDLYDWAGQVRTVDIRKNVEGAGSSCRRGRPSGPRPLATGWHG